MINPKVSIYLPTKNRLELLQRAVNSVVEQTYSNWELIVVNDASTDHTAQYLDDLSQKDKRIIVIHQEQSTGACIARNNAIKIATGDFITGLDDDDVFYENRIYFFLKEWEEDSQIIAIAAYNNILKNKKITSNKNLKEIIVCQRDLLYSNDIGNQVFTKTEIFRNNNGFDLRFPMLQDFDFWYRLMSNNKKIKIIPYNTQLLDDENRFDRITKKRKDKVWFTYNLFIKKHNLNFKEANIFRFIMMYYKVEKYSPLFYVKMAILTFFDRKTITKMNTSYLFPLFRVLRNKIFVKS